MENTKATALARNPQSSSNPMTMRAFIRGVIAGSCLLQGLQLLTPDLLMVHLWPTWARAAAGVAFTFFGLTYVMGQRRLMRAEG